MAHHELHNGRLTTRHSPAQENDRDQPAVHRRAPRRVRRTLLRVLTLVACHADEIAADPALVLKALDASPRSVAICPPGCTGDCQPHQAVWARCTALEPNCN